MFRPLLLAMATLFVAGCAGIPSPPANSAARWLETGETVTLRMPAQLLHGHDMLEPSYDSPEGYQPIPSYQGELLLTDRRMLFVEATKADSPSTLAIPYGAVARARPSQTPLLHYLVVWDAAGHPDSFIVDGSNVRALHRHVGQVLVSRRSVSPLQTRHNVPVSK